MHFHTTHCKPIGPLATAEKTGLICYCWLPNSQVKMPLPFVHHKQAWSQSKLTTDEQMMKNKNIEEQTARHI